MKYQHIFHSALPCWCFSCLQWATKQRLNALSPRLLLISLALIFFSNPIKAEIIISRVDDQRSGVRAFVPKIQQVFQGYFSVVSSGDKETALAMFYPWGNVNAANMPEAINDALLEVDFVKKQIDDNKGIKQVKVLGSFGGDAQAEVVIEVEFNNGFKDISAGLPVGTEYTDGGWTDDFKLGARYRRALPLVGLKAAMKTAESYCKAAIAADIEGMKKLSYSKYSSNSKDSAQFNKELNQIAASIKAIALANGGIKDFEVPNALHGTEAQLNDYNKRTFSDNTYQRIAAIKVNYSINYANGKKEFKQGFFAFDEGRWKILHGKTK